MRDTLLRVPDPRLGDLAVQGVIPKLSDTPGEVRHLGVAMGADNDAVYKDELGLSDAECNALREAGVI